MKQKKTYTSKIVDSIIQGIIDGTYTADTIITERELIEKYGVSRSPVRDALMQLCANHVIKSIPRYGYQILHISREDMFEMTEYRFYLEGQSLRKAVNLITPEDISKLENFVEKIQLDILENPDYPIISHWQNNMAFHLLLVSYARNKYIYDELKKTMNSQLRGYVQCFRDRDVDQSPIMRTNSHLPIIQALEKHDVESAVEALRQDLNIMNLASQDLILAL